VFPQGSAWKPVLLAASTLGRCSEAMSTSSVTSPAAPPIDRTVPRVLKALELPLTLVALLIVPAVFLEDNSSSPTVRYWALQLNWAVWLVFCLEYLARLLTAPSRAQFVRRAWLDLAIIALSPPFGVPAQWQNTRALRGLRLLRVARAAALLGMGLRTGKRALRHHPFQFVVLVATVTVFFGAIGVYVAEEGRNANIQSFGDSLWWAIVTVTTVGYGDVSPTTVEGRVLAVMMMIVGVGVIGVLTAALASLLLRADHTDHADELHERLNTLEAKLDRLLAAQGGSSPERQDESARQVRRKGN
jgi:voltage-gated potassium channel